MRSPFYFDDGALPDVKSCTFWEAEKIETTRRDVLTEIAGDDVVPGELELIKELDMNKMDLARIGLRRVFAHTGAVLHGNAPMSVILDPQPSKKSNTILPRLAKVVLRDCGRPKRQLHPFAPPLRPVTQ